MFSQDRIVTYTVTPGQRSEPRSGPCALLHIH